jgi:hypothetical protein
MSRRFGSISEQALNQNGISLSSLCTRTMMKKKIHQVQTLRISKSGQILQTARDMLRRKQDCITSSKHKKQLLIFQEQSWNTNPICNSRNSSMTPKPNPERIARTRNTSFSKQKKLQLVHQKATILNKRQEIELQRNSQKICWRLLVL